MYEADYYVNHRAGAYTRDNPQWARFFGDLAQFVKDFIRPTAVLDVGCAIGILVEELVRRGVPATGVDISAYAVGEARAAGLDVTVGDLTELCAHADVVICLEVLEHIAPEWESTALDNLCQAVERGLLFSSTPCDKEDPMHLNVQPVSHWIAELARRGMVRRPLLEPAGLIPWGLYFERTRN